MATNICSNKRAIWKPVKFFQEYYDLSKALAYKIVAMEGFPKKYVAEKNNKSRYEQNRWIYGKNV